jgi:nitrate reductase NapE component
MDTNGLLKFDTQPFMKDIKNKVQLIFIPFLIIAIGFIGVYTFLHWAIFLESGLPIVH